MTNRINRQYVEGTKDFAEILKLYADDEGITSYPCTKYLNAKCQLTDTIFHHIILFSFDQSYNIWVYHGEILPSFEDIEEIHEVDSDGKVYNDDVEDLLHDVFLGSDDEGRNNADEGINRSARHDDPDIEKLFDDMEKPLFPRCEDFLVLSFLLRMMHMKMTCKMLNIAMDMILQLLNEAFKMVILSKNHYEEKIYIYALTWFGVRVNSRK